MADTKNNNMVGVVVVVVVVVVQSMVDTKSNNKVVEEEEEEEGGGGGGGGGVGGAYPQGGKGCPSAVAGLQGCPGGGKDHSCKQEAGEGLLYHQHHPVD